MPRPPILPEIDYRAVFQGGKTYRQWLSGAEDRKHVRIMEQRRREIIIDPTSLSAVEGLPRAVNVLVIAEDWCGDVHRHVPVLEALAASTRRVRTRYIARTDHPDVFARFLTNGGEAIPKFVFLNDRYVECGNWGPMPAECRRLIARGKAAGDIAAARRRVSAMYDADPNGEVTAREVLELLQTAACSMP